MSRRARRRTTRRPTARAFRPETLEARVVMSADPLYGGAPLLSQHGGDFSLGGAIVESGPVYDPNADFWQSTDAGFDLDLLDTKIEQTLAEAHAITGQTDVVAQYGFTGVGQTVAVIDTGIAYSHYALGGGYGSNYRVVGGWDFAENDANPYDDGPHGAHGTHVAGIVGAGGGGTHQGVATGVDLVGLRVFDDAGNGYFSWVENALRWVRDNRTAFENPITAVNLSLGVEWNSDSNPAWAMLEDEFAALEAAGVFVSVSAGNSFANFQTPGVSYPASSDHVVPVMALQSSGVLAGFSQRASYAIAAPGAWIASTVPDYAGNDTNTIDDDWLNMSGTSMAAPYVAGASVLVRQAMEFVGRTGIDQWDIYDHMMATAKSFYDSATGQWYKQLDLGAAIDALMPDDDFGSSVVDAYSMGTLSAGAAGTQSILSGAITQLDDADYFTFTAGATGRATFTATRASHELSVEWVGYGGEGWTESDGMTYAMDVTAGRQYTVAISTAGGLGYYDLAVDLEATAAPPIDLGAAGVQQLYSTLAVDGEQAYTLTAGRTGYVTIETQNAAGVSLTVYDAQQNLRGVTDAAGRVDVVATAGEQLFLLASGQDADFELRVTNALTVANGVATLVGTAQQDAIEVTVSAAAASATLNGVSYQIGTGQAASWSIDGAGGGDTLHVEGSSANDTATIRFGSMTFTGGGVSISAAGVGAISFVGGGGEDRANLYDSAGDDVFRSSPNEATLTSASGVVNSVVDVDQVYAYASTGHDVAHFDDSAGDDEFRGYHNRAWLRGVGYTNYAAGFDETYANSTTGKDFARLYDSAGNDEFRGYHDRAYLFGAGFVNYASGFTQVNAYSSGGTDLARLYDSAGNDEFRGYHDRACMFGQGFVNFASGFDQVSAYSTAGKDLARLYDSAGDDEFRGYHNRSYLSGDGFINFASGFAQVSAYATTGADIARLYDSAGDDEFRAFQGYAYFFGDNYVNYTAGFRHTSSYSTQGHDVALFYDSPGDDEFRAFHDRAYMFRSEYVNYTSGFAEAHAFSSGGKDIAKLYDSAGDDEFVGRQDVSSLRGAGFFNSVTSFRETHAYASTGNDTAHFYDSAGADEFRGYHDRAMMIGAGFLNHGVGFDRNFAYSSGGSDIARLYDSAGDDTFSGGVRSASFSGAGFANQVTGFTTIRGYATLGGNDVAELVDSALDDTFTAAGSNAALSSAEGFLQTSGFDRVVAERVEGGSDVASVSAIDYALELLGGWS